ncbi:hypothetical protein [Streptomyces sp. RP5T]|uniref:hypothetical protein n=1 Tax=Streptomyces sp. RP5T TaxID=2490848 RepID=UPI000F647ED6|nr:hypothetical protein [Streptomyces sp. RP5T]RRR85804.1 hypothetical protein EHS43_06800 [Streptomyces sp. RP5T]
MLDPRLLVAGPAPEPATLDLAFDSCLSRHVAYGEMELCTVLGAPSSAASVEEVPPDGAVGGGSG